MTTYLGVGPYERDHPDCPSTHKARSIFLGFLDGFTLLPTSETNFKNVAPADLYDSIFLSFVVLVLERFRKELFSETTLTSFTSDAALYLHIKIKLSPQEVKDFLPEHSALKRESPDTHSELIKWAKRWNVNCDWCLDFAVEAMRSWLFERYARELRLWGVAIERDTDSFIWDALVEHITEESFNGRFSFECETVSFSAASWNYLLEEDTEWRGRITGEFLAHLKSFIDRGEIFPPRVLSRVVSRFEKDVEAHIRQTETFIKRRGYKRVPQVRDYTQFAWTVCYQVLELKLSEVSREFKQPQRTVADGIDRTLSLLGLQKRRGRRGRRPGVVGGGRKLSVREEANIRMRLGMFIAALAVVRDPQKKAHVARAIGVSAQYFSRAWVPYLMRETGCKDYFSLIRKYEPKIR